MNVCVQNNARVVLSVNVRLGVSKCVSVLGHFSCSEGRRVCVCVCVFVGWGKPCPRCE